MPAYRLRLTAGQACSIGGYPLRARGRIGL